MNDSEMRFLGRETLNQGCEKYKPKAHFANPRGIKNQILIP